MKLRNKKTGKVGDLIGTNRAAGVICIDIDFHDGEPKEYCYFSIAELNEDWEDYRPKEPLVGERSQRAVLRAAARLSGTDVATVFRSDIAGIVVFDFRGQCRVELKDKSINVAKRGVYTTEELCGSEEIEILEPTYTTIEEKEKLKEQE